MSDCRWGVKPYKHRPPVRAYDHTQPIRGEHVMKDGERIPWTLSSITKDGKVREFDHEEVDGVRYVKVRERDWDDVDDG